jgi:subfamily B ATP-binding cassette protein HlyB/CyaB
MPLPAIAGLRDGGFVLLARAGPAQVTVQDPREAALRSLPRETFEAGWDGTLILCTRAAAAAPGTQRFGLGWFVPTVLKYRTHLAEVLAASLVLQILGLLTPLFTQVIIDKVLVHRALTTLDVLAAGMLALAIFEALLGGLRAYLFAHTAARLDAELGAAFFRHLLALPLAYFAARPVGDTAARLRELEHIRQFLTGAPVTALLDGAFVIVFLGVMALYSATLTGLVAAALPLYALLSLAVTPALRARLEERFTRGAESHAFLVETVRGMETVKGLALEPHLERRWEERLAAYARAGFRSAQLSQVTGQLAGWLGKVTHLAVLWLGARSALSGALTVGELIAFTMFSSRVTGPVLRLVQLWHEFQQAGVSVARLGDVLNAPAERPRSSARAVLPGVTGRISFDDVHFRYRPEGLAVLRGVSFTVEPGEVVALVGPSGSGKSTIARLLQRLWVPERGRVVLDGLEVGEADPAWLRRRVGVVSQESVLFTGTVRENIALAEPGAPLSRVVAAARLAGAHEFILGLPGGYDAPVGEHGTALSGGQRQRIAIARTLAADPSVLVLDESTSALDHEAERALVAGFPAICRGRTVLLIAHRWSLVRWAGRVLVLRDGRIAEAGRPGELLRAGGYYADLVREQTGGLPARLVASGPAPGPRPPRAAAGG